jgi:hypothetical protein
MKTLLSYIKEDAAPPNTEIYRALQKTGKVGPNTGKGIRVSNTNKLSDADFIKLIQDTFPPPTDDEVTDVVKINPETPPNASRMWPMFVFSWKGRADYGVHLTGVIKGRSSKQTNEQEVSWLLVLAAMYYNKDIINASEDSKEHATLNEMLDKNVYERVYGANGKALNRAGAVGLADWLKENPTWLQGHLNQCRQFTGTVTNPPTKFIKDNKDIPIVLHAKSVFHTSVPDQKFDKDKWNPADVWLEFDEFSASDFTTLDQINKYLKTSIEGSSGTIGVSLKKGDKAPKRINMTGTIPDYDVTGLTLEYGALLAQNVDTEYAGNEMTGYSVMYRLFTASSKETIRGEADKKGSLAMHGKVFLEYLDFLSGEDKVDAVESVKGIHVKQNKDGRRFSEADEKAPSIPHDFDFESKKNKRNDVYIRDPKHWKLTAPSYEFTSSGAKVFSSIKKAWRKLQSSDIFTYNSSGEKDKMDYIRLFNGTTKVKESKQAFLDYLTKTGKAKRISEVSMQTRLSARFQTIALGAVFAAMKQENKTEFHWIVLGMLLYGKSESDWSAPHLKVE